MGKPTKFAFTKSTLKFCIVGLFIPGLTAILILGIQMLISFTGISCPNAWIVLWIISWAGVVLALYRFVQLMKRCMSSNESLPKHAFVIFNLTQYTFIQCAASVFFTSGEVLCYASDGQNGMEFGFTAWIALPVLVLLSLLFDFLEQHTKKHSDNN